ncbi:MAG: leucine-rich repeat domain-containing protein [Clostridia bacterium]|nr:leucine-rich repeat domain-containing protein [Clostridia bacterium]
MKKFLAILICAIMCVTLLASCDSLKHEHTQGEWQHDEEVHWRVTYCSWNKCDFDIIEEQHIDEDKNGICDVCARKEQYIFVLNYDKTGYILSDIGPGYVGGDVVIPSTYRGLPVVEIEMYAFGNCKDNLTSVTIPGSVKEIGMKAFAKQDNLETVIINGSAIVGVQSFYLCPKLKTVVIGEGTEYIYASAFEQCDSLESVTIANTVKKITGNVFAYCKNLKTITIPASVEEIGWACFIGSGFTDIYFEMSAPGESWDEEWDYGLYIDEEIGQETNVNLHWAEAE